MIASKLSVSWVVGSIIVNGGTPTGIFAHSIPNNGERLRRGYTHIMIQLNGRRGQGVAEPLSRDKSTKKANAPRRRKVEFLKQNKTKEQKKKFLCSLFLLCATPTDAPTQTERCNKRASRIDGMATQYAHKSPPF